MMIHIPPVVCARCNKIVERGEYGFNVAGDAYFFEVHCHGEIDRCEVPVRIFQDPSARIVGARAFEKEKTAHGA